ncbi:hypothetical protein ATANTOWER_028620 [Ataeniobius toweri]|uniref:Uncharacterized protein n=1 Tax=Ataeniobius toweri TaxID=208326 RepID=A0ABU7BI26_9TELE|nr:hypothetical protein [Ataeniobius toweri]
MDFTVFVTNTIQRNMACICIQSPLIWQEQHDAVGKGKLVKVYNKIDGAKYRPVLDGNMLEAADVLGLEWRFAFCRDNDLKHTARADIKANSFVGLAQSKSRLKSNHEPVANLKKMKCTGALLPV